MCFSAYGSNCVWIPAFWVSPRAPRVTAKSWESQERSPLMVGHPNIQEIRADSQSPWARGRGDRESSYVHIRACTPEHELAGTNS